MRETFFINLFWGGQQAVRYYFTKGGGPSPNSLIFGPYRMEDSDAIISRQIDQLFHNADRVYILTKVRLEDSYYNAIARLKEKHELIMHLFGAELVLIEVMKTNKSE